jgi:hypothetical protein
MTALQQHETPTTRRYQALTFALAYYGSDYPTNLRRLIVPLALWLKHDPRWTDYEPSGEIGLRFTVPRLLARLHERRHDATILRFLFSWQIPWETSEGDALRTQQLRLLKREPLRVLQTVNASPQMSSSTVEALAVSADPADYRRITHQVEHGSQCLDAESRNGARWFLRRSAVRRRIWSEATGVSPTSGTGHSPGYILELRTRGVQRMAVQVDDTPAGRRLRTSLVGTEPTDRRQP